MDWARAKNIFIMLFFLLNVFLSIILIYTLNSDNITKDTIDDARQALAERGVAIICDIPHFNGGVGTLTYLDEGFDKKRVIGNLVGDTGNDENLSGELDIEDDGKELSFPDDYSFIFMNSEPDSLVPGLNGADGVLSFVSNMLKGTGIPITDYHLDTIEEEGNRKTYIFKQKYKSFLVHENYITVDLVDGRMTYLAARYRKVNGIINSKKVMPLYQVLIRHYDCIKNITITKIDLGFKEHKMDDGSRELDDIPVWRIEYRESGKKQNKFFRAYDGTEIE
ncbi:MAG TPA: two-component system regulatory protein YycI [Acetivibrio sp.]|uniref:two-component system regulatory protein YycI n=1 Tax=Acetivibrio sp. TaxID=1872092 RepID=UPI002C76E57E|nr:two-component system regulatory protein YycI [Acetivibrio sp.]HOM03348.1 two-component system regulatory protein YycI [Acetivibrio sp.]